MAPATPRHDRAGDEPDLVIWFPGPDGEPIERLPPRSTEEVLRDAYHTVKPKLDQVRERGPTRGFRPGGFADRPARTGVRGEVVTSLLVRPARALGIAEDGGLFDPPLSGVRIDERSALPGGPGLVWPVTVRTGLLTRTRATLRLQSSPSANLTVLELLPTRLSRWRERSFVRVGVAAVDQLAGRLLTRSRR
jgi:hypothetical protein